MVSLSFHEGHNLFPAFLSAIACYILFNTLHLEKLKILTTSKNKYSLEHQWVWRCFHVFAGCEDLELCATSGPLSIFNSWFICLSKSSWILSFYYKISSKYTFSLLAFFMVSFVIYNAFNFYKIKNSFSTCNYVRSFLQDFYSFTFQIYVSIFLKLMYLCWIRKESNFIFCPINSQFWGHNPNFFTMLKYHLWHLLIKFSHITDLEAGI